MSTRKIVPGLLFMLAAASTLALLPEPAAGDAASDRAMAKALKLGEELWTKEWRRGAKNCVACHAKGANKMIEKRLNEYPKYDKALRKVVTLQQKLNQMIKKKAGGKEFDLGSAELNALEAYTKTLE